MITIYKDENNRLKYDDTYTQLELRGLSDDTKPTQIDGRLLANGSSFVEIDTGDMYLYDLSTNAWNKIEAGGGGEPVIPTPKSINELNTELADVGNKYGEYLQGVINSYDTYTNNAITIYTPNATHKNYIIYKRQNGTYRIIWFNSYSGLAGLLMGTSSGNLIVSTAKISVSGTNYNVSGFTLTSTIASEGTQYYYSHEAYNNTEECITAIQSNSTSYDSTTGSCIYAADTPNDIPYSNTFIFKNTNGELSTTKRISQNETIVVKS